MVIEEALSVSELRVGLGFPPSLCVPMLATILRLHLSCNTRLPYPAVTVQKLKAQGLRQRRMCKSQARRKNCATLRHLVV